MDGGPRSQQEPINLVRLRQDPPPVYMLGPGDTLGIYIEGVLGSRDEPPPVHFPEQKQRDIPPAIGYPIPIREDGTLPLPLVPAVMADGLTLTQLEAAIRKAYTEDQKILVPGRDRIIVTLMKPRTYKILVIRGYPRAIMCSSHRRAGDGSEQAAANLVELRAYEHARHARAKAAACPA